MAPLNSDIFHNLFFLVCVFWKPFPFVVVSFDPERIREQLERTLQNCPNLRRVWCDISHRSRVMRGCLTSFYESSSSYLVIKERKWDDLKNWISKVLQWSNLQYKYNFYKLKLYFFKSNSSFLKSNLYIKFCGENLRLPLACFAIR